MLELRHPPASAGSPCRDNLNPGSFRGSQTRAAVGEPVAWVAPPRARRAARGLVASRLVGGVLLGCCCWTWLTGPAGGQDAPAVNAPAAEAARQDQRPAVRLSMANGDYMPGWPASGPDASTLTWKSSLFREPVLIDMQAVRLWRFPEPQQQPKPQGRIVLRNGQFVAGDPVAFTAETLTVASSRHGRFQLPLNQVELFEAPAAQMLADIHRDFSTWKTIGSGRQDANKVRVIGMARREPVPAGSSLAQAWEWQDGILSSQMPGAHLLHTYQADGAVMVELVLDSTVPSPFQLAFGGSANVLELPTAVTIDVGDRELTFSRNKGEFRLSKHAVSRKGPQRERWRFLYQPEPNRVTAYLGSQQVGAFDVPDGPLPKQSVFFRSKVRNQNIRRLLVRSWDGPAPPERIEASEYVWTKSGRLIIGPFQAGESPERLRGAGDGAQEFALSEIQLWQRKPAAAYSPYRGNAAPYSQPPTESGGPDAPGAAKSGAAPVTALYRDGSVLQGTLSKIGADHLVIDSPIAASTLKVGYQNLKEIRFHGGSVRDRNAAAAPANDANVLRAFAGFLRKVKQDAAPPAPEGEAVLRSRSCQLHGQVVADDNTRELTWKSLGWQQAAGVNLESDGEIVFHGIPEAKVVATNHDEVHLLNGDLLPCKIVAVDEQTVHVEDGEGQQKQIPRDQIKALRFFGQLKNLALDQWQASSSSVQRDARRVLLSGPQVISKNVPQLPRRMRIRCTAQFHGDSILVLGVGAEGHGAAARHSGSHVELYLVRHGNLLRAFGCTLAKHRRFGIMGNMGHGIQRGSLQVESESPVQLELAMDRATGQNQLTANGVELYRWTESLTKVEGDVVFAMIPRQQELYVSLGNATYFYQLIQPFQNGNRLNQVQVTLSDFQVCPWPAAIESDTLERLLTRPRGAPKSAATDLLRGLNGDTLRGQLVAVHEEQVMFKAGGELLSIPRARVAEVISLNEALPIAPGVITARIYPHGILSFQRVRYEGDGFVGHSDLLGEHRIGWKQVTSFSLGKRDRVEVNPLLALSLKEPIPLPFTPNMEADAGDGQDPDSARRNALVGEAAPPIELENLAGETVRLADFRGKVVVLDFWATWCGPCVRSLPEMVALSEQFAEDELVLLTVNLREEAGAVKGFLKQKEWDFRVLLDTQGKTGQAYGVSAIPNSVVIDREGIVRHVHVGGGGKLKETLTTEIRGLLSADSDGSEGTARPK